MSGVESFSTIAEIAIAFLGFTGVVGVFSGRGHSDAVSTRLWIMVEFGLALLLLSLLPLVLHALGWNGPTLWLTCSIAAQLFLIGHQVLFAPRILRLIRAGAWGDVPVLLNYATPVVYLGCFATQLINSLGVGLERSSGGYLLGLFLLLAASGLNFIALLVTLRSSPPDEAAKSGDEDRR